MTCVLKERLLHEKNVGERDARECAEFLMILLKFDPDKRATASQALSHPYLKYMP